MKLYTGYYFCTRSNWDGGNFDANNIVEIESNSYEDDYPYDFEDYANLVKTKQVLDKERYESYRFKNAKEREEMKPLFERDCPYLIKEVRDWLKSNVADGPEGKGWCMGDDEYRSHSQDINLFFYRRKDALNFIRTWSKYKKPTESYNSDTYVRKRLNLKTKTLQVYEND